MLSTTRKEGADRETDPRRYSLEREPWRFMRPSLAVQFDLRKHSRRERPDLEVEIAAGLESRFAIKRLYFKFHSGLCLRKGRIRGRADRVQQSGRVADATTITWLWVGIAILTLAGVAWWIAR